jgi:hypothetical protein
MVDLMRYPEAKVKADRCFQLVATTLGVTITDDKSNPDMAPVIACWSMAHGLATLMLEGKLGEAFGDTMDQREAAAGRIIGFYAERLAQ